MVPLIECKVFRSQIVVWKHANKQYHRKVRVFWESLKKISTCEKAKDPTGIFKFFYVTSCSQVLKQHHLYINLSGN